MNNNQNQYLNQLPNTNQNALSVTFPNTPPSNINNIPQSMNYNNCPNTPNNNNAINPNFNPQINPIINNTPQIQPTITIQTAPTIKETEVQKVYSFVDVKFGTESKKMRCTRCKELIMTKTEKSLNLKAVCTAIWTLYLGYFLMQVCKNKDYSCDNCEHSCPNCGEVIGTYYAM